MSLVKIWDIHDPNLPPALHLIREIFLPDREYDSLNQLYLEMKSRGVNMAWYERIAHRASLAIPLDDEECSGGSVYIMKKDGSMWTIDAYGKAYRCVREAGKPIVTQKYLCACCGEEWAKYREVSSSHQF